MPKNLEDKLKQAADRAASKGKLRKKPGDSLESAKDRYVYGTMARLKKEHKIK